MRLPVSVFETVSFKDIGIFFIKIICLLYTGDV